MINIVLIGAGQMGSRHLQALALLKFSCSIYVVDPNEESLEISKNRFEQIESIEGIVINYKSTIKDLPDFVDLVLITTNADVRSVIIEEITKVSTVKFMILEKVLFQTIDEYYKINNIIKEKNILTWVNLCVRTWDFYENLKKLIEKPVIEIYATGSLWGLGCNAIHYIDLVSFLTDCNDYAIAGQFLDKKIIPSKRKGQIEFTGLLTGQFSNGSKFVLSSFPSGNIPNKTEIISDSFRCTILENEKKAWLSTVKSDWKNVEIPYLPIYQSQLTNIFVTDIFNTGNCRLPSYSHAMNLHLPMLKAYLRHLSLINNKQIEICQIT